MDEIFQAMLYYFLDEDKENAIYTLRELADGLEEGETLTADEVGEILSTM